MGTVTPTLDGQDLVMDQVEWMNLGYHCHWWSDGLVDAPFCVLDGECAPVVSDYEEFPREYYSTSGVWPRCQLIDDPAAGTGCIHTEEHPGPCLRSLAVPSPLRDRHAVTSFTRVRPASLVLKEIEWYQQARRDRLAGKRPEGGRQELGDVFHGGHHAQPG